METVPQIDQADVRKPLSRCTGNDASARFYTILWNPSATRDLKLHWKKSAGSKVVPVGIFRLRLEEWVKQGHCKREGDKIRFTIWHDADRWLRVRIHRADGGGLEIARLDW
jgi:hypothetical protein